MGKRMYFKLDHSRGYSAGDDVYYECEICHSSIPSRPSNAAACECRNLVVDADAGRVSVKDKSKMLAYIVEGCRD